MSKHACVREIQSALEREALEMRLGLIAFEHNYDLLNVMALPPLSQEVYWKLRGENEGQ